MSIVINLIISFALLGASGCGKTTLLRCCLGYLQQNSGTITVLGHYPGSRKRGNDVPGREVGYMPQVSVCVCARVRVHECVCKHYTTGTTLVNRHMYMMSLHLTGHWFGTPVLHHGDNVFLWNDVQHDLQADTAAS